MKFNFVNLPAELANGVERISKKLGFELSDGGVEVSIEHGDNITAKRIGNTATIIYKEKIHFFRALGLLCEHIKKGGDFCVTEEPQFETSGIMPDLSTWAVFNMNFTRDFLDYMAIMGLNMYLMYIEVHYELPGRKYFGYQRSRYTNEEMKAIDDYAFDYGIEVIPCMQTLGHLAAYLEWPESGDVKETAQVLDVDSEETYKFIEDMIVASMSQLRSKRIHIGMDEAFGLGRSDRKLRKYGLRSQIDLFLDHLGKVAKICDRLGYRPMIWNDFIFCLYSETGLNKYDLETEISQEHMDRFPKNVQLVYWHYGEEKQNCDEYMIKKNQAFGNDVIFAGGLLMWTNALPDNMLSYEASEEGLLASKKCGLKEVFTTLWCSTSKACNCINGLLHMQQYAEHTYHKTVTKEHLKERFEACTGASFDAYMNMSQFGNIMDGREYPYEVYFTRFRGQKFMFQDVFPGKFDYMLQEQKMSDHYAKWAEYYKGFCNEDDRWFCVYNTCYLIFDFISTKTYIAENIRNKYLEGDKEFLVKCEKELYPLLLEKTRRLHAYYRQTWYEQKKAFSFAPLDANMARIEAGTETAIYRLSQYNSGKISFLEELDEPQLPAFEDYYN